jgi:hypothetical protein
VAAGTGVGVVEGKQTAAVPGAAYSLTRRKKAKPSIIVNAATGSAASRAGRWRKVEGGNASLWETGVVQAARRALRDLEMAWSPTDRSAKWGGEQAQRRLRPQMALLRELDERPRMASCERKARATVTAAWAVAGMW